MRNREFRDDGTPYDVYRLGLYPDGFNKNKSLSYSRSVVVCYIRPLGLNPSRRSSSSSTRVVSLVPDGKAENYVLKKVVDDIVEGIVDAVEALDPYGTKIRIFSDCLVSMGHYPAEASIMDRRGDNAIAFYTSCNLSRLKGIKFSECMYAPLIHSR